MESIFVSNVPNYKLEGFVKRVKAKAKQVRDLKRNPRMILVPYIMKTSIVVISSDFDMPTKLVNNRFYSTIKTHSTIHTRGRIIKKMKTRKRKR